MSDLTLIRAIVPATSNTGRFLSTVPRRIGENSGQLNVIPNYKEDRTITGYKGTRNFSKMLPSNEKQMEVKKPLYGIAPVSFTKNMTFYSNHRKDFGRDSESLRLHSPIDRPLVFIFAWLQASEKHLNKYAEFYHEQGYEVLSVQISPWQLAWPVYGSQKVASDIVKFLANNEFPGGIVLHGFSVGGYLWGECLVKLNAHPEGKQILAKVDGQIWDSLADITEIPVGVPHAVLPHHPTLQGFLRNYMTYHLKLFHEEATQYYVKCTHLFHHEPARCPALLLVSKTDPVGTEKANLRLRGIWDSLGMKTSMKCWDKSPHVGHFHKHRDEYIELLLTHLRSLDLPNRKAKL
ncbi:uncharacterized protein LOC131285344 [Anopheles ziemanni]|uniref:uncharacterized protein LOC131285344 n=1 Tax=Anopheles ziemanni TaxID=345580 RepID=UPI00265E951D|nr:uncharacterized protein LOC131285344 [Anopheles ziemanni]